MMFIDRAANVLLQGGVIAYPTEGVYGLGCLPDDIAAIGRILDIKQRDVAKGLILIAADASQFDGWIAADVTLPEPDPAHPVTWIAPPGPLAGSAVRGDHTSLAVRITLNPIARAICEAVNAPIVSTSANISGRPTARNRFVLRRQFSGHVDYIVPGDCGPATGASEIRDLVSGTVLRPR